MRVLSCQRILVAEDEYLIAMDLVEVLEALGAEVIGPIGNVSEGSSLIALEKIHAAVLDVNLQGELVFPLADALAEQAIPFVFATGYNDGSIPSRFDQIERFAKPYSTAEMQRLVEVITIGRVAGDLGQSTRSWRVD
jgi:CheY-like chemotaxis protein